MKFATMDLSGKDYVDLILLGAQNKLSRWYIGANHTVDFETRLKILKSFKERYKDRFKD